MMPNAIKYTFFETLNRENLPAHILSYFNRCRNASVRSGKTQTR